MSHKSLLLLAIIFPLSFMAIVAAAETQLNPTPNTTPGVTVRTSDHATPADSTKPTTDEGKLRSDPPRSIGEDLCVRQVRDGIVVITHSFPWAANSLIVEMENSDLVMVDTPYTPEATRDLLEWVAARFGKRSITAINTGYHHDNLGGNSCLIEQGVPVYG